MSTQKKKTQTKTTSNKIIPVKATKQNVSSDKIPAIVGIGASAGGLQAIEQLFAAMPTNTGIAFVIVTHLDPTHISIMPDIVKNYTDMRVVFAKDGMKVEPNVVYFNPPNNNLDIRDGILYLLEPNSSMHGNLPINFFLESLAEDRKDNAMAIILSGTGSDGTLGIKAIKCEGGSVLVQDPLTAKYDGMPQSAAHTGLADYILPLEKMPDALIKIYKHEELKEVKISADLQDVFKILRAHTGHDFASYKLNTIYRRIERQMHVNHVNTLAEYVEFLRIHPNAINALFKDFLIGVTRFFRDSEAFEALKHTVLPQLFKSKPEEYCIRIWIPGCATGEEVYSLAIIVREILDEMKLYYNVQIFGTDIDNNALEIARTGVYPATIATEVTQDRLKRFFIKEKNTYRVKKEIREMIVFGLQNIIKDPPFIKLDLICCRNLLIYFNAQLQKKLLPIFHFSLKQHGVLFLGTSEAIAGYDDLFRLMNQKWKIFERKDANAYPYGGFEFSAVPYTDTNKQINETILNNAKTDLTASINHFLIDNYSPSCLIINNKGIIVYSHGKAERFVELASRKGVDVNLLDIVAAKIKKKLATAIRKVHTSQRKIVFNDVHIEYSRGRSFMVNFKITPIVDNASMYGMLFIIVEDSISSKVIKTAREKYTSITRMGKRIIELEDELQYSKENLQTTIEELQSSNEELQSTNEELQSTNEEIETSKEELQSLNEELITVNSELQDKIDQLASINDDMNNLFDSTEVLAIFLDNDLSIKRFTSKVQNLVSLIPSDIGRSMRHFAINIKYDNIIPDAEEVLSTLIPKSFEVNDKDNLYYQVRVLPYRTLANSIDGVIITFNDINKYKKIEMELSQSNKELSDSLNFTRCILESMLLPILVVDENSNVIFVNQPFYKSYKLKPDEVIGKNLYSISNGMLDIPSLRKELNIFIKKEKNPKQIKTNTLTITICRILSATYDSNMVLLTMEDENNAKPS